LVLNKQKFKIYNIKKMTLTENPPKRRSKRIKKTPVRFADEYP